MPLLLLFPVAVAGSHPLAGQLARLFHPVGELSLLELIVLMDVEVAYILVLGRARGRGTQGPAPEERHLHVPREAMEVEEPPVAVDSVERRVPFDRLAH